MMRLFIFSLVLSLSPTIGAAKIILRGAAVQGGMMVGKIGAHDARAKLFLDGVQIPISPSGAFVIGFGRDHAPQAKIEIMTAKDKKQSQTLTIGQRQYEMQHIDGLPEEKITPPPRFWPQIRREAAAKRKARVKNHPLAGFAEKFIWPVSGRITGLYGAQRVLNGQKRRPHYGIDIAADENTPIIAPAHGIVTLTGRDFYFEGGLVFLDHGLGLSSAFLHLAEVRVRTGQRVRQGDVIGAIGASGRATGAHLDWRIKWRRQNLDPALIVTGADDCARGVFVARATAICDETTASDPAAP